MAEHSKYLSQPNPIKNRRSTTFSSVGSFPKAGKQHRRKMNEAAEPSPSRVPSCSSSLLVQCPMCDVVILSTEWALKNHESGRLHQRNMRKTEKETGPYVPAKGTYLLVRAREGPVSSNRIQIALPESFNHLSASIHVEDIPSHFVQPHLEFLEIAAGDVHLIRQKTILLPKFLLTKVSRSEPGGTLRLKVVKSSESKNVVDVCPTEESVRPKNCIRIPPVRHRRHRYYNPLIKAASQSQPFFKYRPPGRKEKKFFRPPPQHTHIDEALN